MSLVLDLIGRTEELFSEDVSAHEVELCNVVKNSSFIVLGGAGSIGQAVTKEIFKRDPLVLHVVDISENNMVELVRDIRSTLAYGSGDFRTFAVDCGSIEFEALMFRIFKNARHCPNWPQLSSRIQLSGQRVVKSRRKTKVIPRNIVF